MSWTPERIERLKTMWASGMSASLIADELGGGISRNAVIGKIHRLGCAARGKTLRAENGAVLTPKQIALADRRYAAGKAKKPKMQRFAPIMPGEVVSFESLPPAPIVDEIMIAESRRISIVDLDNRTCRWPIGTPGADDFGFCGIEAADLENKRPYCAYHAKVAYQPIRTPAQQRKMLERAANARLAKARAR